MARLHKDWGKGNTSLGGMFTNTHRAIDDPDLAFLPSQAMTGGLDFARYLGNRAWVIDARGSFSHVSGEAGAIQAIQENPVHYYQRPDAGHLGVDPLATSLSGHGGRVRFGRTERGRVRFSEQVGWISPGLELNDLGYLQRADLLRNSLRLGWEQSEPRGPFRSYSALPLARRRLGLRPHEDVGDDGARAVGHVPQQVDGERRAALRPTRPSTRACCAAAPP